MRSRTPQKYIFQISTPREPWLESSSLLSACNRLKGCGARSAMSTDLLSTEHKNPRVSPPPKKKISLPSPPRFAAAEAVTRALHDASYTGLREERAKLRSAIRLAHIFLRPFSALWGVSELTAPHISLQATSNQQRQRRKKTHGVEPCGTELERKIERRKGEKEKTGAPAGIRTPDQEIKSLLLYQLSY